MPEIKLITKGVRFGLAITDDDETWEVVSPKCRCGNCEDLGIKADDDEGTRNYAIYQHETGDQQTDDIYQLLHILAKALFDVLNVGER